jgi:hypothetical protein
MNFPCKGISVCNVALVWPIMIATSDKASLGSCLSATFFFAVGITAATAEGRSLVGRYLRAAFSGTLSTFTSPAGEI